MSDAGSHGADFGFLTLDLKLIVYGKSERSKRETIAPYETYHNYIGGEWVKSSSGEWFDNVNPADTTDIVGRFPVSNAEDVNRAVEAAKKPRQDGGERPRRSVPKFCSASARSFAKTKTNSRAK